MHLVCWKLLDVCFIYLLQLRWAEQVLGLCDEVYTSCYSDALHRYRCVDNNCKLNNNFNKTISPRERVDPRSYRLSGAGSDTGLGAAPGLDRTGLWRIHNTGPLDKSFNWGDSDDNGADEFLVDFFGTHDLNENGPKIQLHCSTHLDRAQS